MDRSATARRWPAYTRVPHFLPVPLRARADGWTPLRQARFIGLLAETGSVAEAARRVGMSRISAYRLRDRPGAESFVHAWDAVIGVHETVAMARGNAEVNVETVNMAGKSVNLAAGPGGESVTLPAETVTLGRKSVTMPRRKVTGAELFDHAMDGPFVVTMRRGRFVQAVRKPSVPALLRLVRQCDRAAARVDWAN